MRRVDTPVPDFDFRDVVANKRFTMAGHEYKVGDPVDVASLPDHKVQQFLDQRILRPSARTLEQRSASA